MRKLSEKICREIDPSVLDGCTDEIGLMLFQNSQQRCNRITGAKPLLSAQILTFLDFKKGADYPRVSVAWSFYLFHWFCNVHRLVAISVSSICCFIVIWPKRIVGNCVELKQGLPADRRRRESHLDFRLRWIAGNLRTQGSPLMWLATTLNGY